MQIVRCVLYLAANVEYNMHPIVNILTMKTEIHSLEYLGLNVQNYKYAVFDSFRIYHGLNQMERPVYGSLCGI